MQRPMADVAAVMRRLRSQKRNQKQLAAIKLEELAGPSPAAAEQLVAAGCVPLLLCMLRSGDRALHAPAASALNALTASSEQARQACAAAIPALVAMLSGSDEVGRFKASGVLGNLAVCSPDNCADIVAAGGHMALLRLIASSSAEVQRTACRAAANLALNPNSRAVLILAGAFQALCRILQHPRPDSMDSGNNGGPSTVASAISAIMCLCLDPTAVRATPNPAAAAAAAAAGVPAALVQQLRRCASGSVLQESICVAINVLVGSLEPDVSASVVTAAGVGTLAELVCSTSSSRRTLTAVVGALVSVLQSWLQPKGAALQLAITRGLLPRLVQLLGGAAGEGVQEQAAALLVSLSAPEQHPSTTKAVVSAGVAPALAIVLSSSSVSMQLQQSACHLATNMCAVGQAAALRAAGAADHLQRLAASSDPDVSEAATDALRQLAGGSEPPAAGDAAVADGAAAAAEAAAGAPADEAASAMSQRRPRACAACGAADGALRKCAGCRAVRYCSEACMREHWKAHRADCRRAQAERAAAAPAP